MNTDPQTLLGRYKLGKVLGRGAMGVVYEATDMRLSRTVAIKTVLRSFLADESTSADYTARFEREAQAAARLNHPHIVAVFDFGAQDDVTFIVMEFVRGRELGQAFADGEKFGLEEAVRIMSELLDALAYAHEHGVVHRDVKPANVMIDSAGRVKLTDFGVARLADSNQDRTLPGTMVGTPSYMAPEQILGLAVGSRADIFGAGVVLYQFLTGTRPFVGGGPFGIQRKIVHDEPVPPSQLNPALPAGFDAIVTRALAKQPEDRYETAAVFAADLRRVLNASQAAATGAALDLDLDSTVVVPLQPPPAASGTLPPPTPGATVAPPPLPTAAAV
ncbi:MAG: serine/threonine protein kinase, partial [Rubrivivax sp.]|nr:serine/threonine protein kinase [Rubrivivax sp.]